MFSDNGRVSGDLLVERRGDVAFVTLNRPQKRNALSIDLRMEMAETFATIAEDDSGCVLLTGAGTAFCSGMDTSQFGGDSENRQRLAESSFAAFGAVGSCPKPIVAAVNGPAIAGGFALSLLCDLRLASETARMGFPELPAGIPPAYAAARSALDPGLARELCLTGRVLDASEARELGVVMSVHPADELLARATELAESIASLPRSAVLETKRRVLIERETVWGPLFEREREALREALLGQAG
jgi:enoyl-CoA hydratase/carnithine racemase